MIKSFHKLVVTRKPHICYECKKEIPPRTKCYWFKSVAFKESDIGRNEWMEFYICPQCDMELRGDTNL